MASKARTIVLWVLSALLALLFLLSGSGKLANGETAGGLRFDEQFEAWGLPAWARFPVGLAEVAGAVGLLVPRLRFFAAAGLTLLMAGAVATHLRIGESALAAIPLALGALTATAAWLARPAWVQRRLGRGRAQTA
jgi:putative oxidoreductase